MSQVAGQSNGTFAVVVNWNGGDDNLTCVASLRSEGFVESQVILVDNASSDGSIERLVTEYPDLQVLRNESNEGYGHGVNKGVARALELGASRVLLVNNDLSFEPGAVKVLEERLDEAPTVGIVGPRIVYRKRPGTIWSAGAVMTYRQNLSTLLGHGKPDGPKYQSTLAVDYVAGAALLARREVFEQAGFLDGDYFAYHEDLEFCLRAGEFGYGVECVGAALAHHDAHASTGGGYNRRRKYMMAVNSVRFLRQHGTVYRWLSFFAFDIATLPLVWLLRAPRGEGAAVTAKALGTWHGLLGRRVDAEVVRDLG